MQQVARSQELTLGTDIIPAPPQVAANWSDYFLSNPNSTLGGERMTSARGGAAIPACEACSFFATARPLVFLHNRAWMKLLGPCSDFVL